MGFTIRSWAHEKRSATGRQPPHFSYGEAQPTETCASAVLHSLLIPLKCIIGYTTCLFFSSLSLSLHLLFHYVMMMNMNIKGRHPATIWAITKQLSSHYVGQAVGVLHHPPKHRPVDRFVFVVKSVLDWLSGHANHSGLIPLNISPGIRPHCHTNSPIYVFAL